MKPEDITAAWPQHFDTAIRQLNKHIIPAFRFSPKELLLGIVVNTAHTPLDTATAELQTSNVDVQLAYVDQQRLDATDLAALHAAKHKAMFDQRVARSALGVVTFESGQLVQVHDNSLNTTLSTTCKLPPRWSAPRRIVDQVGNSYRLTTLEGFPINGLLHARRLRQFIPRGGTALAELEELKDEERNPDAYSIEGQEEQGEETMDRESNGTLESEDEEDGR